MREILFKAKNRDFSVWVQGQLHCIQDLYGIYDYELKAVVPIDKKTLCQYTGRVDKNGRKVFENDIVKSYLEKDEKSSVIKGVICYYEKGGTFGLKYEDEFETQNFLPLSCATIMNRDLEVIGNIFDMEKNR